MAAGSQLQPDPNAIDAGPTPSMPPVAPAPAAAPPAPGALASPQQPVGAGAGAPDEAIGPPKPNAVEGNGQQKGKIATPDVKLKFDQKALSKAQTTLDVLNAATEKSRTAYMDWWQKAHGDIDKKYDALQAQLGGRPPDNEQPDKKEKFAALLEFGLHLMKNSARPTPNQGAALTDTLADSIESYKGIVPAKQKAYDQAAAGIEGDRQKELAGIGTPAAAQKEAGVQAKDASDINKNNAGAIKDLANASEIATGQKGAAGHAQIISGNDGTLSTVDVDEDGHRVVKPLLGIDGKPVRGRLLGTAGSGIDKTPNQLKIEQHYVDLGMDRNTAVILSGHVKTGNAAADRTTIYKSVLNQTDDPKAAQAAADRYVQENYRGGSAIPSRNSTFVPPQPPASAVAQIPPGKAVDFGPGHGIFAKGLDGSVHYVGPSRAGVQ